MPLVPEKLSSRQEIRNAIGSQFWEHSVESTRSLDGIARMLPCEPPTLTIAAPSGLNRSQQLLMTQAVGLPWMPAYNDSDGGLVSPLSAVMLPDL